MTQTVLNQLGHANHCLSVNTTNSLRWIVLTEKITNDYIRENGNLASTMLSINFSFGIALKVTFCAIANDQFHYFIVTSFLIHMLLAVWSLTLFMRGDSEWLLAVLKKSNLPFRGPKFAISENTHNSLSQILYLIPLSNFTNYNSIIVITVWPLWRTLLI